MRTCLRTLSHVHSSPCTPCLGIFLLSASLSARFALSCFCPQPVYPLRLLTRRAYIRQIWVYCRAVNGPGCLSAVADCPRALGILYSMCMLLCSQATTYKRACQNQPQSCAQFARLPRLEVRLWLLLRVSAAIQLNQSGRTGRGDRPPVLGHICLAAGVHRARTYVQTIIRLR